MTNRTIKQLVSGMPTQDGAGVSLTRIIGQRLLPNLDPFLMLDPFISYKEEIIEHLNQFDPLPHQEIEQGKDMGSLGGRGKKSYE